MSGSKQKEDYLAVHDCKKCDHRWVNRKKRKPKACPRCKSVNWDEKKKA